MRFRRTGLIVGRGLVVLACAVDLLGCTRASTDRSAEPVNFNVGSFDGAAAFKETARFLEIGPRVAGSPGMERAAVYLHERLQALGIEASIDSFLDRGPLGETTFHNVIATLPGPRHHADLVSVLLVSHTDTKFGIADDFVGANDSGSSTGLLLAIADYLARLETPLPFDVVFAFVDGEECRVRYGPYDGLHGSRHLARNLEPFGDIRAAIVLDMIGDRDLSVTIPRDSDPSLTAAVFEAARALGGRTSFGLADTGILDDHTPLVAAGVPTVNLIDFKFGSAPGRNDYWHTPEDTLDKVSAESLELVGKVTLSLLEYLAKPDSL